jgi:cell division protein FtsB
MVRRPVPTPNEDAPDEAETTPPPGPSGIRAMLAEEPDLATLPIVGITRRRAAMLLGVLLACWVVFVFARQVSEASAATGRAEAMVAANAAKRAANAGLERELAQIQGSRFVLQQARGYGLGGPGEIPFTLQAGAPPLPADAPGSAAVRVGAATSVSPLERWLTLLFGPGT